MAIRIQKSNAVNPSTGAKGYVFRQVETNKVTQDSLAELLARGGTFSKGEARGLFTDFPPFIADALANNGKVSIDGLGTFSLSVSAGWKADKADLKKSDVTLGINFTPDASFLTTVQAADITVVSNVKGEDSEEETDTESGGTTRPDAE